MSYAHWDFVRFIQNSGLSRAWWRTGFTVSVCIHDIIDGLFFLIFQIIVMACLRIYTKLFFVLWFILDFFCSQTFWSCNYSLSSDPCKHTLFSRKWQNNDFDKNNLNNLRGQISLRIDFFLFLFLYESLKFFF